MRVNILYCILILLMAFSALGLSIGVLMDNGQIPALEKEKYTFTLAHTPVEENLQNIEKTFKNLHLAGLSLSKSFQKDQNEEKALNQKLAQLAKDTSKNKNLSNTAYEEIIISRLGNAVYRHNGNNSDIMIFKLQKEDLRGYMAKIKLKNSEALRVTINPPNKPKGEKTAQAAKRLSGIFAVNGGGFATSTKNGSTSLVPLGNAMVNGQLTAPFMPSWNDLAFAGFSKNNKLLGGIYYKEKDLLNSGAWQGVSFVPVLVKNWQPQPIPAKWAEARQPRTVLGQYPNGDIFFIVVDGRQSNWSSGITLEEIQILLLHLGVMEAFNLDGGGSSAMYYQGKILNKPSDGEQRPMATNIVVRP
ncbi:MAG: phosphodiester glycosidase family protein [Clostridiales bacterium]